MAEVNDFLSGEDGDAIIENGDLKIGESTLQHQRDLLLANKGEYRQNPTIGVGLNNFIDDNFSSAEFNKEATLEFENDGMQVIKIVSKNTEDIIIDAEYGSTESDSTK
jgi:hypothetical protein